MCPRDRHGPKFMLRIRTANLVAVILALQSIAQAHVFHVDHTGTEEAFIDDVTRTQNVCFPLL